MKDFLRLCARVYVNPAIAFAIVAGVVACCPGCGFAHRGPDGGFTVFTLFKDIRVEGDVLKKDGTRIKGEVTSDVSADALRAAAEGAAAGAVRGVKP